MTGTSVNGASETANEVSRSFRAMNTDVLAVVVDGGPAATPAEQALAEVERLFGAVEACASRFLPESELSRLNRSAGRPFAATPLLFALVSAALGAAAETGGAFDPTLLDALERAGYDRSFERLSGTPVVSPGDRPVPAGAPPRSPVRDAPRPVPAWRAVRLDPVASTITLPPGCRLDLGGIGKGWTVDRAAASLRGLGHGSFALDAGGDLWATGRQGDGQPWTVGVADPEHPARDLAVLVVDGQAVATSTTARRRWRVGGEVRHHLIDPRTGRPAATGVTSATVVAGTVARAETLAKAALVLGPVAGRALLERLGVPGLLRLDSGGLVRAGPHVFSEVA